MGLDNRIHTPEGLRDIYGKELKLKSFIEDRLLDVLKLYHYDMIETPLIEYFNVFNGEKGTASSNQMYKLFDRENNTLVIRPDITPSIARSVAKYFANEKLHIRLSYKGQTFMNRPRLHGNLNGVTQLGAELIGDDESAADGEILSMAVESMLKLGLSEFQVSVGQVDFFRGIVEEYKLDDASKEALRDAIVNNKIFVVKDLSKKAGIPNDAVEILSGMASSFDNDEMLAKAKGCVSNDTSLAAIERLEKVYQILKLYGYEKYVSFDLSLLSDYDYYSGIVFKGYTYGSGSPVVGGGRYNGLISKFGVDMPSVGYAFVVDELMFALSNQNLSLSDGEDGIMVLYDNDDLSDAISAAKALREKDMSVLLMRKSSRSTIDEYIAHALTHEISKIVYISEDIKLINAEDKSEKALSLDDVLGGAL
ncbi:MAG: ATP phosphoribosyltransferase regulatory subunit [Lachnospiraceae bacterium]|nr:ATP phosphoribosyltransferase regulatory subunit [Lachnospiraceae bacterium]